MQQPTVHATNAPAAPVAADAHHNAATADSADTAHL